jgi:Flp pilus assembly protein TadG
MRLQRPKRRGTTAQGLLEFALITPMLLLLLFGIIDFGWMVFNFSQLYNALREGTRYGSVPGFDTLSQIKNCSGIKSQITTYAGFSGVKAANITVWYDDGRAVADDTLGTNQNNVVGSCDSAWGYNGSYSPVRNPQDVNNGDRIVIDVNVNVQFLTPFIRAFAPNGVIMHLRSARSIFPYGLQS